MNRTAAILDRRRMSNLVDCRRSQTAAKAE